MASEAVTRKKKLILNRLLICILFIGISGLWAQQTDASTPSYKKFRREYKYVKQKDYTGPERSFSTPAPMREYDYNSDDYDYEGLKYSPEDIQKSRSSKKSTTGSGGSNGNKQYDPQVKRPDPIEIDPIEIDPPDIDAQPLFSPMFWKVLLIIIGFILLAWLVYLIVKNYKPKDAPAVGNFSPSEWNPELIPKTELELRLEEAMLRNDYRECVRIYFTFILKELIRLRRIKWKKELTNIDYLIQVSGKDEYKDFQESVRIYDLIWYGEYEITLKEYEQVVSHLEKNYKTLTATHE